MFHSRLFRRMFLLATPVLAVFSVGLYFFAVPLIQSTAFEIEQNAGRTILNNVFDLANRIHLNLERQRAIALQAHERQLKNVVTLAAAYGRQTIKDAKKDGASEEQARTRFFEGLRSFQYGNNDYVWVADYQALLVSHPDPDFHNEYVYDVTGDFEKDVVRDMVEIAKKDGEGYLEYDWRRLGDASSEVRKLSYFRAFPEWQIVIGTGVYIDDIAKELEARRVEAIEELRQGLRNIQIAKTGYLYIFDSDFNMIIHPNSNIEDTNFSAGRNPLTNRPIGVELVEAAEKPDGLIYKWDKPTDPGNYAYDKIAWVRHFKAFDWYIASSVYVEELKRSSKILGNRILTISIIGLLLSIILMSVFIRQLIKPIHALASAAKKVQDGNYDIEAKEDRDDEIGLLSQAFNAMVAKVRDNIDTLDSKVRARTTELEETNRHLTAANTAQEQARRELAQSEHRQRLILDAIPAYIGYLDVDRRLLFANRPFAELILENNRHINGVALEDALPQTFYQELSTHLEAAYAGASITVETAAMRQPEDGCIRKNTFIPEFDDKGDVQSLFFLSLDITEEKQVEHKLMEAQRIRAVGQLSGGLAHDFNNLLSVIIGNLATACEKFSDQEQVSKYISPALRAGRRGADIANRLLAFSRKQPLAPTVIEMRSHVAETIKLLRGSLPEIIEINLDDESQQCQAYVDANQLENALINLSLNAKDAMPDGGLISLKVEPWQDDDASGFDEQPAPGDYVAVTVEDRGSGFSEDALEHAFEPFYTTKQTEGGTGLGLSMVYGFVKQSNGYLKIAARPKGGARITLLLPSGTVQDGRGAYGAFSADLQGQTWPGRLALLVDDDTDVRATTRQLLLDLEFSVLEAANAEEALQLLENVEDVYVMVSDIVMPGALNGYDLARICQQAHPDLHLLLMTGYAPDMEGNSKKMNLNILRKPFDIRELERALIEVTGSVQTTGSQ